MNVWLLSLHPDAEIDVLEGYDWYADRNLDTAEEFSLAVKEAGKLICKAPYVWPIFDGETRKYTFKHFPYKLIYRIIETRIEIIAVAHDRRQSNYWANRIVP